MTSFNPGHLFEGPFFRCEGLELPHASLGVGKETQFSP